MVLFSQAALLPLDQIWLWNAEAHGRDHARTYVAFLVAEAGKLGGDSGVGHHLGRPVPNLPHLRYVVIRRRARGHGHLAVFQQIRDAIVVLQFYHTAQDWQVRLGDEADELLKSVDRSKQD